MTRKFVIKFPAEQTGDSLTYNLIKKFDIRINILKADIDAGRSGTLLIELNAEEEKIQAAVDYISSQGMDISPVETKIKLEAEKCISCGACTSSCLSGALSISAPDWNLRFEPEKCIVCKLCLKACPLQLFKIEFSE
ncbi:MAG: 4Fe-4S binding protein [Prevotella sp.]|nr:4Fe-4S binding protein [Candidatus Equicola faecalis]